MAAARPQQLGGGAVASAPIVFDAAAKLAFTASGSLVRVRSIATGETVRVLRGHTARVTAVRLNPDNIYQIYSASQDGTVKLWDFQDAVLLKTFEVGVAVRDLLFLSSEPSVLYLAASSPTSSSTTRLYRHNINKGPIPDLASAAGKKACIFEASRVHQWAAQLEGNMIAAIAKQKLHIVFPRKDAQTTLSWSQRLVSLAVHPTTAVAATGDAQGKIVIWHDLNRVTDGNPVTSVLHWHAHAAPALSFTSDASYLVSGGEEAVLVLWQIGTGTKRFLPRLGAPLTSVTVGGNDTVYGVVHSDNTVRFLDALSFKQIQAIQGLRRDPVLKPRQSMKIGLLDDPRSKMTVLNGTTGCIQFYNADADRLETEHQVVDRLYISRTQSAHVHPITVDHVAFTQGGKWMATVESRRDSRSTPELVLKFWQSSGRNGSFVLKTRIDTPHQRAIVAMAAHPKERIVVTCGRDHQFKLWAYHGGWTGCGEHTGGGGVDKQRSSWRCMAVGSYKDFGCRAAQFSPDGSLLAVAFGKTVTLWDPLRTELRRVLPHNGAVEQVVFLGQAPFLVARTADRLYVWNLLQCAVWWTLEVKAAHLCADPRTSRFALVAADNAGTHVLQFEPEDIVPIASTSFPEKQTVISLAYLWRDQSSSRLVLMDDSAALLDLTPPADADEQREAGEDKEPARAEVLAPLVSTSEELARANFARVFGSAREERTEASGGMTDGADGPSASTLAKARRQNRDPQQVLDMPAHVMPRVDQLAQQFFDLLLHQQAAGKQVVAADGARTAPSAMSEDGQEAAATDESEQEDDSESELGDGEDAAGAEAGAAEEQAESPTSTGPLDVRADVALQPAAVPSAPGSEGVAEVLEMLALFEHILPQESTAGSGKRRASDQSAHERAKKDKKDKKKDKRKSMA